MKFLKKLLLVVLALCIALSLFACKKDGSDGESSESIKIVESISFLDYSIIRAEKTYDALLDKISDAYLALTDISGNDIVFTTDYLDRGEESDPAAKEILIGHTNRPETAEVLSQLENNEYAVAVVGNKIVITGIADSLTPMALDWFVETYLSDGADGMIEGDLFYRGTTETIVIVDKGEPIYTLVRSEGADKGMLELCYRIADSVEAASGVVLPINSDRLNTGESHDDSAFEILFGDTNYKQTQEFRSTVTPDEYKIECVGNKLVIFAWNAEGIRQAVDFISDLLTYSGYTDADGRTSVIIPKQAIDGDSGSLNYYLDVPYEAGGRLYDSVYDSYDKTVMLYWENADENMIKDYASELENMGYAKHQSLDNESVKSLSYVKNKALVHIYLLKRVREFRVITQDNAALPVNEYSYTELCEPAVTQIGIEEGIGMSYLIRLADGTFVIFDGGYNNAYDIDILYNTMLEQKPEGIDDVVVSAWILTHDHGDHIGCISGFMSKYNRAVTVKMLIGNAAPDSVHAQTSSGRNFSFNSVNGAFGSCVYKKAHTGEQFFFPGVKFTILYTHEDLYPDTADAFNNVSTVVEAIVDGEAFSGTVKSGETRFIWLGDAQAKAAKVLEQVYYTSLKCDVLQLAHHGNANGGSTALYNYCAPRIAFWPASTSVYDQWKSATQNKFIRNTVDIIYLQDDGNKTIWFEDRIDIDSIDTSEGEE